MPKGVFPRKRREPIERFMEKVEKTDGCWLWKASGCDIGYGWFKFEGRCVPAHRFLYEYTYGKLLPDINVCHRCDNPQCVRPDHMFAGTDADNHADRDRKGRTAKGERNGRSKLTAQDVAQIRLLADTTSRAALARRFGVDGKVIYDILNGNTWKNVA